MNTKNIVGAATKLIPKFPFGNARAFEISISSLSFLLFLLSLLFSFLPTAHAAEEVTVNFFLNHGAAYRDGSWVPLDVYVDNKAYDIIGTLEVRTFSLGGDLQSPINTLPIESPAQSTKRFRLYVFMQQCSRIEIQLYNGRSAVLDNSSFMQVMPIGEKDYLCMILDDAPEGYGFLSTSLFKNDEKIRFHRENLDTEKLGHLSDKLQCYEPFDLIVLGKIDPQRIAQQHRDLLRQYVERGGTLVICTGDNAPRYKGSWLEELAGAKIGEQRLLNGEALAAEVFEPADAVGAVATRETLVAALTPALTPAVEGVQRLGKGETTLATLRKLGDGHVAMLAVDSDSQILQTSVGYQNLWRDLARRSLKKTELNYAEGVMFSAATLPRVAGVELAPVSSVITYLATYFVVAILLNWLFWNFLKRREMAWVCLIFFSIGFTAYAMIYGTQGRARSTELEQIEILRLPAHSPLAQYTSYTGILAKGTGTFSGIQTLPNALMYDPKIINNQYNPYGRVSMNSPVTYLQEEPHRFDGLRVGASEMRFVVNSDYVELDGVIEGEVTLDGAKLSGTLSNKTGLTFRNAMLLANGNFYKLGAGDTWDLATVKPIAVLNTQNPNQYYPGYYDPYNNHVQTLAAYEEQLIRTLVMQYDTANNGQSYIPEDMPPLFVAWADSDPYGGLEMNIAAETKLKSVMLVADVGYQKLNANFTSTTKIPKLTIETGMGRTWDFVPENIQFMLDAKEDASMPGFVSSSTWFIVNLEKPQRNLNLYKEELHIYYCNSPDQLEKFTPLIEKQQIAAVQSDTKKVQRIAVRIDVNGGQAYSPEKSEVLTLNIDGLQEVPFVHEVYLFDNFMDIAGRAGSQQFVLNVIPTWNSSSTVHNRFYIPVYIFARLIPKTPEPEPSPTLSTSEGVVAWQP